MKIQTNSKNIESLILPTNWLNIPSGTKIYNGVLTCFRCGITGYYKGGGTKSLNSTSDSSSNVIIFENSGKIYKNGTLDNGDYEYILITGFGTNGSCTHMGVRE